MDRAALDASVASAEAKEPNESRLDRIAALLGCPVEAFADGAPADDSFADASELLRLWLAIPQAEGRGKVLALARKLAQS